MKCCASCAHCKGSPGTWYDPPESWCALDREEFEMEDEEYEAELAEKYGNEWYDIATVECEDFLEEDDVEWLRADSRCYDDDSERRT